LMIQFGVYCPGKNFGDNYLTVNNFGSTIYEQ